MDKEEAIYWESSQGAFRGIPIWLRLVMLLATVAIWSIDFDCNYQSAQVELDATAGSG